MWPRFKRGLKIASLGTAGIPVLSGGLWYGLLASERQRECLREALVEMPTIITGGGGLRLLRSAKTGLCVALNYKFGVEEADAKSGQEILSTCLSNGGLYVKVGQGLATMNHVLPEPFTTPLKVLQDQCLQGSQGDTAQVLLEDLGRPPEEIFASFDPEPIAAASLAQVFRATTLEGREVAVKIQYPDLQTRFHSDIPTIRSILLLAEIIHPELHAFQKLFSEIVDNLKAELDFVQEGKNAERTGHDLRHLPWVYVPQVHWKHSSSRILTMEYIHGAKISDKDALAALGIDLKGLGRDLIETFAEQICKTGFVHADPHPGNLLVRKRKGNPGHELVILDHGLYEVVPEDIRRPLCAVWKAIVLRDHDAMQRNSVELGIDSEDYRYFCMTLSQHYISPRPGVQDTFLTQFMEKNKGRFSRKDFDALSPEDKAKMRADIQEVHERVLNTFQKIPKNLVLIFRNLNTIRSIIKDHDSGVERYRIIAKVASRGMFVHANAGLLDKTRGLWNQLVFDYRLLLDEILSWIAKKGLSLWISLGYNPML